MVYLIQFSFHELKLSSVSSSSSRFADFTGRFHDLICLAVEFGKDTIPIIETFATRLTMRHAISDVATGASVTFVSTHSGVTDASTSSVITLLTGRAQRVTLAGSTAVVRRVAPIVSATLVTSASTETFTAFALPIEFVTLGCKGAHGIAITRFASGNKVFLFNLSGKVSLFRQEPFVRAIEKERKH